MLRHATALCLISLFVVTAPSNAQVCNLEGAKAPSETQPPALVLAEAGRAASDTGDTDLAREKLAQAVEASETLDNATRARTWIHIARSHVHLGDDVAAADLLVRAHAAAEQAGDKRLVSYALGYLAERYVAHGRDADARTTNTRAVIAAQEVEAVDALYRWQWQQARIEKRAGNRRAALEHYRQAVHTLSGTGGQSDPQVAELYLEFVDQLLQHASTVTSQHRQPLLEEARNALEDQSAAELRDHFQDPCLAAQRKSAPDEVPGALVVYPVLLEDRIELIVSRGGKLTSYVVPVRRGALTKEVRNFRLLLEKRSTRQYRVPAQRLYEWLIRPLHGELANGGIDTLVFVPTGPLRTIPLAALRDEHEQKFLIEKIAIAVTPGLTLTEPRPINRESVTLLAAGLSESVQGFRALDAVPRELKAVTQAFPTLPLLDGKFVTDRFEQAVTEQHFDIVHVASHGEFSADAAESFLLTYDGRIPIDRLGELLRTTRFREQGVELLVLSACKSAAGDDRAALGLAGVAISAGARSALATLWSVNDDASATLISEFYSGLSDPQLSRATALQRAQVQLLHDRRYSHPFYWAPYLLLSNWL